MSYFSRVTVDVRGFDRAMYGAAQQGDAYLDHKLVWQLFPDDVSAVRDFAFRAEKNGPAALVYYLVSQRQPQAVPGLLSVQSKPFDPHLQEGEMVRFDLRANPTISRPLQEGQRSRRHDVLMHAKQGEQVASRKQAAMEIAAARWLVDRAAAWGLEIEPESILAAAYAQHRLDSKGRRIQFSSVDYQGIATVADGQKLRHAMLHGVGHAKAFGCGLLLVKRLG